MNYIHCFIGVLFFIGFLGCKKQGSAETLGPPVLFKIENAQGQDLLDPATPGYFVHDNIRKYDLINGEKKLYYKPNLAHPYGYIISKTSTEGYIMYVAPNKEEKISPTTTYIDWGNGDRDTFVFAMTKNDGAYIATTDIWYNGVSIFNVNTSPYWIKIVK
ncbi:MAG TPA: hypothetical protein DCQ50_20345 [Chryseobacterium sp.]|nr:hypothetical protein [Chryseobacterium sp.]